MTQKAKAAREVDVKTDPDGAYKGLPAKLVPFMWRKGQQGIGRPKGSLKRLRMNAIIRRVALTSGVEGGERGSRFEEALTYLFNDTDRGRLLRLLEFCARYVEVPIAARPAVEGEQGLILAGERGSNNRELGEAELGRPVSLAEQIIMDVWRDNADRLAAAERELAVREATALEAPIIEVTRTAPSAQGAGTGGNGHGGNGSTSGNGNGNGQ